MATDSNFFHLPRVLAGSVVEKDDEGSYSFLAVEASIIGTIITVRSSFIVVRRFISLTHQTERALPN